MIQLQGKELEVSAAKSRVDRLAKFTSAAITYSKKKDIHRCALCMQVINNEKLYLEGGYKTCYECINAVFGGITRATVSNYLTIARRFLDANTGKTIFADGDKDFVYTQLIELKKLKVDEVRELMKDTITYDSTVAEIKEAVTGYKARLQASHDEERERAIAPLKKAYEDFHKAYNELSEHLNNDSDKELMQRMMDSVVLLYNENDRLWEGKR